MRHSLAMKSKSEQAVAWLRQNAQTVRSSRLSINTVVLAGVGLLLVAQLAPIAESARLKNQCVAQWRSQLANSDRYKEPRLLSQHLIRICHNP